MKKSISIFVLMFLCMSIFAGCSLEPGQDVKIQYTSEILINKETPDSALVWAGVFQTPEKGDGLITSHDCDIFGIIEGQTVHIDDTANRENYYKYFAPVNSMNLLNAYVAQWLNIDSTLEKFSFTLERDKGYLWEDTALIHFYVPANDEYEGKPTEFAGKYIFIERKASEDKTYLLTLEDDEYHNYDQHTSYKSAYVGRIGDKFYVESGWYDLSTHTYQSYKSQDQLPKQKVEQGFSNWDLLKALKKDAAIAKYLMQKDYYADTIINNVSYMNGIITNVLELSKLESGKIVPVKNVVNLNTLLKTCQEKYEGLIENKTLTIEYGVLPDIKGDENLLMQAFDNLLSNAIKYSFNG